MALIDRRKFLRKSELTTGLVVTALPDGAYEIATGTAGMTGFVVSFEPINKESVFKMDRPDIFYNGSNGRIPEIRRRQEPPERQTGPKIKTRSQRQKRKKGR